MKQDVIASLGAIRREVRACEQDGRPARAIVAERSYDTTVDDVWDAVTNRERIARWLAPIDGDLRLGGRYQLEGNAGGEITTCDPPAHLALTWELGGGVTWVDVHLSADPDGGTLLRLEHVALSEDLEQWGPFGPGAVGIGWDLSFLALAEHLLTGDAVDVDAEVAASPVGVDLIARSSEAWCDADIASGTPEDDARAAAARTTALFTGTGDPTHGDPTDGDPTHGDPTHGDPTADEDGPET
jgi:uncharacterized protein YndB with AHSA1/START domain